MTSTLPPLPPRASKKESSFASARNCMLLNLLATPGLGSLMGRRYVSGSCQLLLAVAGFASLMLWFFKMITIYYGQIVGESTVAMPPTWMALGGGLAFAIAWIWSFITSVSLFREARSQTEAELRSKAPPTDPG